MSSEEMEEQVERILYNLESEYMTDMDRVYKGKDSPMELGINNQDSSKRATEAILALIAEAERKARVEELEKFNPFFIGDHSKCPDPRTCIGYMNAVSDYENEREIRLAQLQPTPSPDSKGKTSDAS